MAVLPALPPVTPSATVLVSAWASTKRSWAHTAAPDSITAWVVLSYSKTENAPPKPDSLPELLTVCLRSWPSTASSRFGKFPAKFNAMASILEVTLTSRSPVIAPFWLILAPVSIRASAPLFRAIILPETAKPFLLPVAVL